MMDTNVRADANGRANGYAISIETEDDGDPEGNPWTDAQLRALIDLNVWICETHGIPPELARTPTGEGLGWHSMWGFKDPLRLEGPVPNPWTPSFGKTCPGRTRINQFVTIVVPRVQDVLFGDGMAVTQEEFDAMAAKVDEIHEWMRDHNGLWKSKERWDPQARIEAIDQATQTIQRSTSTMAATVAKDVVSRLPASYPTAEQIKAITEEVVSEYFARVFKQV